MTKPELTGKRSASAPSGCRASGTAAGAVATELVDAGVAGRERALEVSRQRLQAAQCRIDALVTQNSLLQHQVALLQRSVAQARRFSHHDELTGLPNRRLLLDRYTQAVALAARQDRRVALLFLDIDGFKSINDAHGHAAGDWILRLVADRLRACIRTSDTACRYGGDEFVILLPELDTRASAVAAAAKIRARLAAPYSGAGTQITVTASIGVALYPLDGREYEELIRVADVSMYREKLNEPVDVGPADPGVQRAASAQASMQALAILMKARHSSASLSKGNDLER